jgi:hypothetical protein
MQAIVPYSLSTLNLGLVPLRTPADIAQAYSPLYYILMLDDFHFVELENHLFSTLEQSVVVSLWFTLQKMRDDIIYAGTQRNTCLPSSNGTPIAQHLFKEIQMPIPAILTSPYFECNTNPLYFLTTASRLENTYYGLQRISHETIQWMETTRL